MAELAEVGQIVVQLVLVDVVNAQAMRDLHLPVDVAAALIALMRAIPDRIEQLDAVLGWDFEDWMNTMQSAVSI
jgi:plasmid maintenance system antidote protein VapI